MLDYKLNLSQFKMQTARNIQDLIMDFRLNGQKFFIACYLTVYLRQ
jgi:hypothetical protein